MHEASPMDSIHLPISGAAAFSPDGLRLIEEGVLAEFVQQSRWFGGKARVDASPVFADFQVFDNACSNEIQTGRGL